MDKLKNALSGSGSTGSTGSSGSAPQAGGTQPAGGKDFGDKGFDSVLNKTGYGDKVSDSNREKITDAGRNQFEKATGKNIPDKFSN